jgi:PKD repeat protein
VGGTLAPSHTYLDDGAYAVTLTVVDDDGGVGSDSLLATVTNVAPTILSVTATVQVNVTLIVAGEKWHSVDIGLYQDGVLKAAAGVVRYPGDPKEQSVTVGDFSVDLTKSFDALIVYTPEDDPVNGQPWGANPVWVELTFPDGTTKKLHHTFNVRHPGTYLWDVDLVPELVGSPAELVLTGSDPGSDDLTVEWNFGDGAGATMTAYNDGIGPDPDPSPDGTAPMTVEDVQTHAFLTPGPHMITVTLSDDDGGVDVEILVALI